MTLPVRPARLRLTFSASSAYLTVRVLSSVRAPARSENPPMANPGSTSGADGVGSGVGGSQCAGLAWAAVHVASASTSARNEHLANFLMAFFLFFRVGFKATCPGHRHPYARFRRVDPRRMQWSFHDGCVQSGPELRSRSNRLKSSYSSSCRLN